MIVKIRNIISFIYKNLFSIFASCISLNNFIHIFRLIWVVDYHQDEFQHAHITWNTYNGELIYRDFFEHHGPLYPFFNNLVLQILRPEAGFETLSTLRVISFITTCLIALMLFAIVRKMTTSNSCAIYAVAFYSTCNIIERFSYEIRPDSLQTLAMLIGVFFLISNFDSYCRGPIILSGTFFGIMLGFNFKTIIVLVAIFTFMVIEAYFFKNKDTIKKLFYLLLGIIIVVLTLCSFFWINGAFKEFIFYNTIFNINFNTHAPILAKQALEKTFTFFFQYDLILTLLAIVALITARLDNWGNRLFACLATITLYGSFHGLFPYYAMIYIPFYCYFLSIFLNRFIVNTIYDTKQNIFLKISIAILAYISFGPFSNNFLHKANYHHNKKYTDQINLTDWALKNIPQSQKVAMIKSGCVASIFHKQHKYFWRADFAEAKAAKVDLKRELIKTMEDQNIQYLFVPKLELSYQPKFLKNYIYSNFKLQNIVKNEINNCVWKRKLDKKHS